VGDGGRRGCLESYCRGGALLKGRESILLLSLSWKGEENHFGLRPLQNSKEGERKKGKVSKTGEIVINKRAEKEENQRGRSVPHCVEKNKRYQAVTKPSSGRKRRREEREGKKEKKEATSRQSQCLVQR